jgi:hypothetical protein
VLPYICDGELNGVGAITVKIFKALSRVALQGLVQSTARHKDIKAFQTIHS